MDRPLRIGLDIGGVLSKYPDVFKPLVKALFFGGIEVHIITDIQDRTRVLEMLKMNGFDFILEQNVHLADYEAYGELCKSVILREKQIDVYLDDHPGYLTEGCPVRLLMMPSPAEPYYSDIWKTDGSEGTFGRRIKT